MSYLVLARKYRPQTFDEIVGQEHVTQTLTNAIAEYRAKVAKGEVPDYAAMPAPERPAAVAVAAEPQLPLDADGKVLIRLH